MSVSPRKINVYSDSCFKRKTSHLKTNNWRIYWLVCGVVLLAVKTLSRDRKLTIAMCPVAYAFITREKYHRVCTQKKKRWLIAIAQQCNIGNNLKQRQTFALQIKSLNSNLSLQILLNTGAFQWILERLSGAYFVLRQVVR